MLRIRRSLTQILILTPAKQTIHQIHRNPSLINLIPVPVSVIQTDGVFTLPASANIHIVPATPEVHAIGQFLADILNASTKYEMLVVPAKDLSSTGNILLTTSVGDPALGDEGYNLTVTEDKIVLSANQPVGLFRGVQTLRQLLPPEPEKNAADFGRNRRHP